MTTAEVWGDTVVLNSIISLGENEEVLEMDGGSDCTMWMYLMSQNSTREAG